jgi:hypothetical protein
MVVMVIRLEQLLSLYQEENPLDVDFDRAKRIN